jgi:vacuolar-type H+-ATPase subunit C/Vma6
MSNIDFIVAKVRGMHSKLYEGDKLRALCDARSVEDLAAALAPGVPLGDTVNLQKQLTTQHVAELHKLLGLLDAWQANLFLWLLRRYQVENIKVILRCRATANRRAAAARYTADLPGQLELPADVMLQAADLETMLNAIPVRELRQGALVGLGDFEESGRLFFIEAGLDQAYFNALATASEAARGEARGGINRLTALERDNYNVMLVLRGVFNYSIVFNRVRLLLAPEGRHATADILREIGTAPSIEDAARQIPPALLGPVDEEPDADSAETAMWRNLRHAANRVYYDSVLDFAAVVAFTYLKRIELGNLVTLSECARYGEPGATARRRLIGMSATPAAVGA